MFFQDPPEYANPLSRAPLTLRPARRRSCFATLPIGGKLQRSSPRRIGSAKTKDFSAYKKFLLLFAAAVAITLTATSCKRGENSKDSKEVPIATWLSQGITEPPVKEIQIEENLPKDAFPLAGTVSHHLLAGICIDQWFKTLADARKVETFFIISPSHYGLSTQEWSLCECEWNAGKYGLVKTDKKTEMQLAKTLCVEYDRNAYRIEHGFSTLMPYIAKYFPKAKVCTVALNGEPPLKQSQAQALTQALSPYFTEENSKKNFLLISTDFSHHGDLNDTQKKDSYSRKFFQSPAKEKWFFCVCDNRQGMYVLSNIFCKDQDKKIGGQKKFSVLYHTNSFELSGEGGDDITSYFFTFMY
ncbi:MAG: AmmeMemoRadiSam system protein B [Treponema sp.]|nr:AmmeMemoRadiSam system protein B [Treponema sp.]